MMNNRELQPVDFDPFADLASEAGPRVEPDPSDDSGFAVLPLTSMQRELYAAVQMGPQAAAAFNLVYQLHLQGPVDLPALQRALAATVRRHDALSARMLPQARGQVLVKNAPVELPLLDLVGASGDAQRQALADLIDQETREPFVLTQAPLWRSWLVKLESEQSVLLFSVHHLVFDGWSSSVFFSDWAQAYRADLFGIEPQWPEAKDYAGFVQAQLAADNQERERVCAAYWLAQHAQAAPVLSLPLDHVRPAFKTYACGHEVLSLPAALAASVRQLGARHGCTLFMTLLTVVQGLAARLGAASDVVVGIPMAVQTTLESAHLVADGAQTVPLRCAVDLERPFVEQLHATRAQVLAAQTHLHCSFGLLVHQLQLPRDPSRTPLVDLLFNLDRAGPAWDFGPARLSAVHTPKQFSNAELSFNVLDDGQALSIEVHYLTALYEAMTLRRWLQLLQSALERLSADAQLSLAEAFAPSDAELAQLAAFNATDTPQHDDGDMRLDQRFAQQARQRPDAQAVWYAGQGFSYRAVETWAEGVAERLMQEGVQPGDRVAVACGRGPQTLAALLGVMKTGAAYVPLDLSYPAARLQMMLDDAGARMAVCDDTPPTGWGERPDLRWVSLRGCEHGAAQPATGPHSAQLALLNAGEAATQAAYIIYTSGSTGRPKGVAVSHRSVINYLDHMAASPGLAPNDRLAGVTALSFDMSVTELYLPMTVGASLVMIDRDEVRDGARLTQRLLEGGVTVLQAAPSIWRVLLEAGWHAGTASGRLRAWTGGEALSARLAQQLLAHCSELWNLYGPTETTVFSTIGRIAPGDRTISVGAPIANTRVHVLDEHMRRLPLGATGEIWIGGAGVAIGYWGQPALTEERFRADPFRPGHRLYRTGDLGRWRSDGSLECLGRVDHQVKLRGQRIELGEVESALAACGIAESLALLHVPSGGDPVLAVYVVAANAADVRWDDLREQLRARLPDIMVPTHGAVVTSLPLLPNGKIHRHALPPPAALRASPSPAEALTPVQQSVADIWMRALDLPAGTRLSTRDNFFDLGGHSLLATQVSLEMEARLGFRIGVPRLVMESLGVLAESGRALPTAGATPVAPTGWLSRWSSRIRR